MISNKSIIGLGVAAMVAFATSAPASAQQYKKIARLGTSQSVCTGGVETAQQLQTYFANNPGVIRTILADSGWSGSADALLQAVANGEMTETSFPAGTKLAWMGSKKNGKYVALPYREWAGAEPFEGFSLNIKSNCRVYEMAIPKACCNVSLIAVSDDPSSECSVKSVVSAVGEDAPATLAPAAVAKDPLDQPLSKTPALGLVPFIGAFLGSETRARFEPSWQMDMRDASGVVGLKAGLLKKLSEKTSLTGVLSYYDRQGINDGNIYPEDNFAIDIGLERKLSEHAFIGGGIGAWNVDDSDFSDTSVYGLVGGDFGDTNFQWFIEGRVFDSDSQTLDSFSDNKMFSAGLRYLIK